MKKLVWLPVVVLVVGTSVHAEFDPYVKAEAGFMKYQIPQADLLDVSSNLDTVKVTKSRIAPLGRISFGWEYDDFRMLRSESRTTGRFGLSLQYAAKKAAIVSDYFDTGFTVATYEVHQDIKRFDMLGSFEYDFTKWKGFMWTAGIGVGMSYGALKDFKLYQKSNGAFIGQSLAPYKVSPTGFLSFAVRRACTFFEPITYELGYRLGLTRVQYKADVVQTQPDATADWPAQNAFNLLSNFKLARAPHQTIFGHHLSLGVEWKF